MVYTLIFFFLQKERLERVSYLRVGAAGSGGLKTWVLGLGALFVGPQEAGNFGTKQLDEGLWQHLLVLLCVLEVVLGVGQHLKEGLNELLVLQRMAGGSVSIRGGKENHQPLISSSTSWCLIGIPRSELWIPILPAVALLEFYNSINGSSILPLLSPSPWSHP